MSGTFSAPAANGVLGGFGLVVAGLSGVIAFVAGAACLAILITGAADRSGDHDLGHPHPHDPWNTPRQGTDQTVGHYLTFTR